MSEKDRFWTGAFDWRPIAFWWVAFSVGLPRHTFYAASADRGRPPPCDARPAQIDPLPSFAPYRWMSAVSRQSRHSLMAPVRISPTINRQRAPPPAQAVCNWRFKPTGRITLPTVDSTSMARDHLRSICAGCWPNRSFKIAAVNENSLEPLSACRLANGKMANWQLATYNGCLTSSKTDKRFFPCIWKTRPEPRSGSLNSRSQIAKLPANFFEN